MTVFRTPAIEMLYWLANRCCILADRLELKPKPTTLNGVPVSASNTLVFSAGEKGRILGPDGFWHELSAQEFPWKPRLVRSPNFSVLAEPSFEDE